MPKWQSANKYRHGDAFEDRWEENRAEFEALVSYMKTSIEACLSALQ